MEEKNTQYHKTVLVPYGLGHFRFCFMLYIELLHTAAGVLHALDSLLLTFCIYSVWPALSLLLSPPLFFFPSFLLGQVQCRCWWLSIMKRWEEEEEKARCFRSYPGMNYSPSREECLSTLYVCTLLCVSVTTCLNAVTLYLAVSVFISYAEFSLSLADAKWLIVLCMVFGCKVSPVARCDTQQ